MNTTPQINKTKKRAKNIPTFLKKTCQILQDSTNSEIIKWASDGIGFIIIDQIQFQKLVLPKYFKHSKYSSFVRQLNMYNFHKMREVQHQNYFRHQLFDKNNMSLIEDIKRKPQKKKKKIQYDSEDVSQQSFQQTKFNNRIPQINKKISKISTNKVKQNLLYPSKDSKHKIYFYQQNINQQSNKQNQYLLNNIQNSTTMQVKTQIQFLNCQRLSQDQISIQNCCIHIPQLDHQSILMKTKQLISSRGSIFRFRQQQFNHNGRDQNQLQDSMVLTMSQI